MAHLSLSLLGPFQATLDGEPITGFEATKVRALLAYLAVEASQPHPRTVLAGLLYGFSPFAFGLACYHPAAGVPFAMAGWLFCPAAFLDRWTM